MSKQQLYINGKAVDMPTDEIKIKVESNIFSDADKIKTAHSYNIALPRTMTNDSIFALAYVPSAETGGRTTHTYLKASLYMDGVPLFVDGQAVLTSVDEKGYNLNLFWGLLNIFDTIKEESLNLCDLPNSSLWSETYSRWIYLAQYDDQLPEYISGMTQARYDTLDNESKYLADKNPWLLPSVRATRVFTDVLSIYNLGYHLSADASARLAALWHPLVSRKATAKGEDFIINGVITMGYVGSGKYVPTFLDGIPDTSHPGNLIWANLTFIDNPPSLNHSTTYSNMANATTTVEFGAFSNFKAVSDIKITKVRIFGTMPVRTSIFIPYCNERHVTETEIQGGQYVYDVTINDEFSCKAGETIFVITDSPVNNSDPGNLNVQFTVAGVEEVQTNHPWEYIRNYPEIKVIDYLSEILAHIGGCIVGSVAAANRLNITTFDEIVAETPIELDTYGIQSITMTLDDLAQKNVYTHEENDDNDTEYKAEGVIYTDDKTLEVEREAFKSHFKVPIGGLVRLWKVEQNDDNTTYKAEWVAEGDYIAGHDNWGNVLMNTGQDFASTISDYYTNYEKIINHPKEIEVVVRLSVLDLLNFDMARPVYITQLGRKYLIKSLESDSGEKYKLTLVQI